MINIKKDTNLKILDKEVWLFKNNKVYIEKSNRIMDNNFIVNYKELENIFKTIIKKYKLNSTIFQNKIIILINKLYCETNIFVIKQIMYNLGYNNYSFIYEEDLYKDLYTNIISIWKDNGIYIKNNVESYIDINNKNDIKKIKSNTLLITSNKEIIDRLNKDIIIYEETDYPIFKMINKEKSI